MSHEATDNVTTIGTDIGKNGIHLIGLDRPFWIKRRPSAVSSKPSAFVGEAVVPCRLCPASAPMRQIVGIE